LYLHIDGTQKQIGTKELGSEKKDVCFARLLSTPEALRVKRSRLDSRAERAGIELKEKFSPGKTSDGWELSIHAHRSRSERALKSIGRRPVPSLTVPVDLVASDPCELCVIVQRIQLRDTRFPSLHPLCGLLQRLLRPRQQLLA
jgi:hypothetical protein